MELKEFIKHVIVDIMDGVAEAQEEVKAGEVVPAMKRTVSAVEVGVSQDQPIEFEVRVQVDESSGSAAKLGVLSGIIGAGVSGNSSEGTAIALL